MTNFLKAFDTYSLRARIFPAIIAAAPALAALALLISWKSFELSNAISTLAVLVLLFAIGDFARSRGRAIEQTLYAEQGGMFSITMFRRNDPTIDEGIKERYRVFLAQKLGVAMPSADTERTDQSTADSFYRQCGVWLRQNTRDTKRFHLLFSENVTYGFRRNLYGVRWLALALNLVVVTICILLLRQNNWPWETDLGKRATVVLLVAAIHVLYLFFAVRKAAVLEASRAYAREMILACEAFLSTPAPAKRGSRSSKKTTS